MYLLESIDTAIQKIAEVVKQVENYDSNSRKIEHLLFNCEFEKASLYA